MLCLIFILKIRQIDWRNSNLVEATHPHSPTPTSVAERETHTFNQGQTGRAVPPTLLP